MKKAVVSEKGQVTIPKPLRRSLGLGPGTVLAFEEDEGRLVGRRIDGGERIDALVGTGNGRQTDTYLRRTRGAPYDRRRDGDGK